MIFSQKFELNGNLRLFGMRENVATFFLTGPTCLADAKKLAASIKSTFGGDCIVTVPVMDGVRSADNPGVSEYIFTKPLDRLELGNLSELITSVDKALREVISKENKKVSVL